MEKQVFVDIGRTTTLQVGLGFDVSADAFTSEIREQIDPTSPLIATWNVVFATDGVDGELILTIDDTDSAGITQKNGYMDIKRVSNGEPLSVFEEPLSVIFRKTVTA